MLLLPRVTRANPRRVAYPNIVSCRRGHLHKPLAVPSRLHPHQSRRRQSTVKLLRFAHRVLQLLFSRLSRDRVHPTNLLPTGMVITSNNHHRRLLPTVCFGPPNRSIPGYERSLRSYPIKHSFLSLARIRKTRRVPQVRFLNLGLGLAVAVLSHQTSSRSYLSAQFLLQENDEQNRNGR